MIDARLGVQSAQGNQGSEGSLPTSAQPGGEAAVTKAPARDVNDKIHF